MYREDNHIDEYSRFPSMRHFGDARGSKCIYLSSVSLEIHPRKAAVISQKKLFANILNNRQKQKRDMT